MRIITLILLLLTTTAQAQFHAGLYYADYGGCSTPAAITGALYAQVGGNTQLSDATAGGTWSSTTTTVATIGSTGLVTAVSVGTSTISYSTGVGCLATTVVTVIATPSLPGTPAAVWNLGLQPTVTLSTGVSAIADQTGNSRTMAQATANNQPAYTNNGANSYLTTDGVIGANGDFMQSAFTLAQPFTIIMVIRQHWTISQSIMGGVTGVNRAQIFMNTTSPNISLVALSAIQPTSTVFPDNTWKVLTVVFNGSSSTISVNNAGTVTGNPGTASAGGITWGRDANDNSTTSNIDIAYGAVWSSALSGANQTSAYNAIKAAFPTLVP
jgi:hypothetical protein